MSKALILNGEFQYIDRGTQKIKKPATSKWVPVIYGDKPVYNKKTQYIKTTRTLNENDYTITYELADRDIADLITTNVGQIRDSAANYIDNNYDDITVKQLNSFGSFGNSAQAAEAKKVFDWKNEITKECLLRVNEAINTNVIQSLDYSQFDVTNPNVTVENVIILT